MTIKHVPDRQGRLSSHGGISDPDRTHGRDPKAEDEPTRTAVVRRQAAARGRGAIGAKIVEEAAEVVEAGGEPGDAGREHLIREAADLVFHTMVLLGFRDVAWGDVEAELARRFGISGITEKESRRPSS